MSLGKKTIKNNELIVHLVYLAPAVLAFGLFALLPVVLNVWYSFTNWNAMSPSVSFIGWANYARLFADPKFFGSLGFTILFVCLVVPAQLVLSLFAAVAVARQSWFTGLTRFAVLIPLALSPVATGLLFNLVCSPSIGIVPLLFGPSASLGNVNIAIGVVTFAQVWSQLGITTFIFLSGVIAIPRDYYEAAALDGAGPTRQFLSITLPLLRGPATVNAVFAISLAFRSFGLILVLTDGNPLGATRPLSLLMYRESFMAFQLGYGSSISTVLLILIATASLVPTVLAAIPNLRSKRA